VFSARPLLGNPLAVVVGANALTDSQMAAFSNWTNLSETAFLLRPKSPDADYRVRIFTPGRELPFAGDPTLGSCHVWLALGGARRDSDVLQECEIWPCPHRSMPRAAVVQGPRIASQRPREERLARAVSPASPSPRRSDGTGSRRRWSGALSFILGNILVE
jgi:predicted PhzF superfamily epimerase YddE/YHI9